MKPLNIGILTHSFIMMQGLAQLLHSAKNREIKCHNLMADNINAQIAAKNIRLLIADPTHPAVQQLLLSRTSDTELAEIPIIALCTGCIPEQLSAKFNATITTYDSPDKIFSTIQNQNTNFGQENNDKKSELTSREKEIVVGIVKGLSNKEIASDINVSVNTVMTHRRNIASKLQIHSPAGLTIYAIVSKLVSIDEIKHSIN